MGILLKSQSQSLPTVVFDKGKEIIQSYVWSTAKYDMTKLEKRIMYKIIESIQFVSKGEILKNDVRIDTDIFFNKIFSIPTKEIFIYDSNDNYESIIEALRKLRRKDITIETDEVVIITGIIDTIIYNKRSGLLQFSMKKDIFEALLNFSKGWRSIQLDLAMSLSSKYSMRLYEIVASKEQPHSCCFSMDKMKDMLGVKEKYKRNRDFRVYVLNKAKNELDKKSPISFNYSIKRDVITIVSYRVGKNEQNKILNQEKITKKPENLSVMLPKEIRHKLRDIGFSDNEMVVNMPTLVDAKHQFDTDELLVILSKLANTAKNKKNPNGYIINALKGKIKDKYPSVGNIFANDNI